LLLNRVCLAVRMAAIDARAGCCHRPGPDPELNHASKNTLAIPSRSAGADLSLASSKSSPNTLEKFEVRLSRGRRRINFAHQDMCIGASARRCRHPSVMQPSALRSIPSGLQVRARSVPLSAAACVVCVDDRARYRDQRVRKMVRWVERTTRQPLRCAGLGRGVHQEAGTEIEIDRR